MKIVRHIAPDMRTAMRAIRDKLGEDAVILSSRRIPEGVELTAAIDFDTTSPHGANTAPTPAPLPAPQTPANASRSRTAAAQSAVVTPEFERIAAPAEFERIPTPAAMARQAASPTNAPSSRIAALTAAAIEPFSASVLDAEADSLPFAHIFDEDTTYTPSPARAPAPASIVAHVPAPASVESHAAFAAHASHNTPRQQPVAPIAAALHATGATAVTPTARREPTLDLGTTPDLAAEVLAELHSSQPTSDTTGSELKTLRRMLETQLAQLAWNDMARRAPVHVEILRELTEIGISQELSDYILKQLPDKVELGFARRFAIAGLSQYLLVTGDRWLDDGGRVAFIGATGVGKTTTIAKLAVRWVLRHGPRDLALVGCDTVRIGAQDQIQALGQLLAVPAYTPDNFESLPTLLSRIGDRHRLILIDTPGSSLRDPQLSTRLGVLANSASQLETALVLSGSTQAGAIEETVKRFAPANPACCVLTKLDEAASLGGALSVLIKARIPVSYLSDGQRVPEDLRPARALELVSTAVRLAKATGAAADEDLLRRRFGKSAHAIS